MKFGQRSLRLSHRSAADPETETSCVSMSGANSASTFHRSEPLVGTLEAFAVYAVDFVARPVGAAIFGHYGHNPDTKAKPAGKAKTKPTAKISVGRSKKPTPVKKTIAPTTARRKQFR